MSTSYQQVRSNVPCHVNNERFDEFLQTQYLWPNLLLSTYTWLVEGYGDLTWRHKQMQQMQVSAFHVGIDAGIKSKIFILPIEQPISGPGPLKDQKLPVVGFVRCFELEPLTMVKLEAIVRPARQMESICSTESAFRHLVFTCFQSNFSVLSQFFWPGMFPHLLSGFH